MRATDGLRAPILLGWLATALILTLVSIPGIAGLHFPDPDDAMRLLEVRDWLAGQSWWDVAQHRLNSGAFAMHWSRLVDLPLAAVIAPLDPLIGQVAATRVAITIVPLLTLLAIMALTATLTDRVAGRDAAKLAILLTALAIPIVYQARPVRIDHHGWQIVLALAAVVALLARPTARNGALAGLSLAALVTISLEGLPITACIAGVALLAWAIEPARRAQAMALAGTLLGVLIALHVATRGPAMMVPACDAIAPAWIAAAGVALLGALATMALRPGALWQRFTGLAIGGIAGAAILLARAPDCTKGPFATLDPLVYTLWYRNVSEGLPVWDQLATWAVMTVGLPIVGLAGAVIAWRAASGEHRARWTLLLAVAIPAFALSVLVVRAGATANALAIPGAAFALHAMLTRARRVRPVLPRTLATAGALLAASPGLAAGMALTLAESAPPLAPPAAGGLSRPPCVRGYEVAALAQLPPATVFAPVDISPQILATTAHRAVAAGYHRNSAAMNRVFKAFLAPPEQARTIVIASGAVYLVACPGMNETNLYAHTAPNGLWARLERGERIAWLRPVAIAGSPVLAWRIVPPHPRLPESAPAP